MMVEGKEFHTDKIYHVTPDVAHVLIEQMNRGWAHEELTEVRDHRTRRRWGPPPGIGFGNFMDNRLPRNMTLSTDQLAGAVAQLQGIVAAPAVAWSRVSPREPLRLICRPLAVRTEAGALHGGEAHC